MACEKSGNINRKESNEKSRVEERVGGERRKSASVGPSTNKTSRSVPPAFNTGD